MMCDRHSVEISVYQSAYVNFGFLCILHYFGCHCCAHFGLQPQTDCTWIHWSSMVLNLQNTCVSCFAIIFSVMYGILFQLHCIFFSLLIRSYWRVWTPVFWC